MRLTLVTVCLMALVALATHASAERGLSEYEVDYEDCNSWDLKLLPNTRYVGKFSDLKSAGVKKAAAISESRASANPPSELLYPRQIRVPFTSIYLLICISPTGDRDVTARLGSLP
jgi:hypothetical protein